MKTKPLQFYIDLPPGWQDIVVKHPLSPCVMVGVEPPTYPKFSGYRRFVVVAQMPCFGGSADIDQAIPVTSVQEVE